MKSYLPVFMFLLVLLAVACSKDDDDTCDTTDITYSNTVADIFDTSCATSGCHVYGNEANAVFSLQGYANSKAAADLGGIVAAISHESYFPMPKGADKLGQCEIDKISAWVAAGAPE